MAVFGKVYSYAPNPRVARMKVLAEMNGLVLEDAPYDRAVTNKTPEFLAKFPLGQVPGFEGDDGFLLVESAAIARYIAQSGPHADRLLGKDLKTQALITQWSYFAEAELIKNLSAPLLMLGVKVIPYEENRYNEGLNAFVRDIKYLEKALEGGKKYLVGNSYTLADIMVVALFYYGFKYLIDAQMRKELPNLVAYAQAFAEVPLHKKYFGELEMCETAVKP